MALEPFPRQILIGGASATMDYRSTVYDALDWSTVTWSLDVLAGLPGTVTDPLTMFVETSEFADAPDDQWVQLIPGGEAPNVGTPATGTVTPTARFIRFRVRVTSDEIVAFAIHAVGRGD
jgi:hypothetical protein